MTEDTDLPYVEQVRDYYKALLAEIREDPPYDYRVPVIDKGYRPIQILIELLISFSDLSATITEFHELENMTKASSDNPLVGFNDKDFLEAAGDMAAVLIAHTVRSGLDPALMWSMAPNPSRDFVRLVMAVGDIARAEKMKDRQLLSKGVARIFAELKGMCDVVGADLGPFIAGAYIKRVTVDAN